MVAQTKVGDNMAGGNGASESAPRAFARNTGELLSDALTLAELQGRLAVLDVQDDLRKLIMPLVVLAAGGVVAASCLPVAMVTLAMLLIEFAELSHTLSFSIALLTGLVLATGLLVFGVWYLRKGFKFLERSRGEWNQNVRWLKNVMRRLGSSDARRQARPESQFDNY